MLASVQGEEVQEAALTGLGPICVKMEPKNYPACKLNHETHRLMEVILMKA
jgi:hypothetical protein